MSYKESLRIVDATPEDAPMIADAILDAVGETVVSRIAGKNTRSDVHGIFARLATRDDSQYSYRNTRIALLPDGTKAGVCVSYDGGLIKPLRRSFFDEANRVLGWNMSDAEVDSLPGETCGEEFYLDTLSTIPQYRGHGIGSALIADAKRKASQHGLPLGLLVADDNPNAKNLYKKLGFKEVGRRLFAGEEMTNMRLIN